jgi:GNAT superfamily N-acetyltransferase
VRAHLRPAVEADVEAIARVHVDTWRTTYAGIVPDEHLAQLSYARRQEAWLPIVRNPLQHTVVCEVAGELVGFANGGINREPVSGHAGELYAIYLRAAHQRRGLGAGLVGAVATALRGVGHRSMIVWVLRDNPACRFYAALGGAPAGDKKVVIGGRELAEIAYGWADLGVLTEACESRSVG